MYNILFESYYCLMKTMKRYHTFSKFLFLSYSQPEKSELSDILSTPILKNLLTRKTEKYPFSRGRPNLDLAEERRGSLSYYEKYAILQIIDIILNDSERLKKIDDIVTNDKAYQEFVRYVYGVKKEEKEQNEIAFRKSYSPIIPTEEIKQLKKHVL